MSTLRSLIGPMGQDIAAYLALKRALGRKFVNEECVLRLLDRFLARRFPKGNDLSIEALQAWMADSPKPLQPQTQATRLRIVRQFCLYRRRASPGAFVPDRSRHPTLWPSRVGRRLPFVFTKAQVKQLLSAALHLPSNARNPERPRVVFTLLLLLYTTGLRVSEAVRLRVGDVDLVEGTLRIVDTKFFKTRLVPVSADVLSHLRAYVEELELVRTASPDRPLFQSGQRRAYALPTVKKVVRQLLRECGLKPATGRGGARLHDLRATFAVHRITRWYEEGADVQTLLPVLATYMGHKDIASTQYYATVTGVILEHAGRRFELACAPKGGN